MSDSVAWKPQKSSIIREENSSKNYYFEFQGSRKISFFLDEIKKLTRNSGPDTFLLHSIMSSRTICRKNGEFTSSRTILDFVNDLLCARIAEKLIIFFTDIFVQGIAKELNYEMVRVSKVPGNRKCPKNSDNDNKSKISGFDGKCVGGPEI